MSVAFSSPLSGKKRLFEEHPNGGGSGPAGGGAGNNNSNHEVDAVLHAHPAHPHQQQHNLHRFQQPGQAGGLHWKRPRFFGPLEGFQQQQQQLFQQFHLIQQQQQQQRQQQERQGQQGGQEEEEEEIRRREEEEEGGKHLQQHQAQQQQQQQQQRDQQQQQQQQQQHRAQEEQQQKQRRQQEEQQRYRHAALLRLVEMFPDVDEKTIERVMDNYGDNLDAAIQQLHQLRLSSTKQDMQQQASHQQGPQSDGPSRRGGLMSCGDRLSSSWLDIFLREFYESRQHDEAQGRVIKVLEAFETAVIEKYRTESEEMMALKAEFDKLKKDNAILSKAVAVQHSRLQELNSKDQELQRMREMLTQYQDRLRTLELSNYALTMHLQRATGPNGPGNGGPPDVF